MWKKGGSYPVASRLRDILTNFLGGQTQRTDLGGERGGGTDLTSGGTEVAISTASASSVLLETAQLPSTHRSIGVVPSSGRGGAGQGRVEKRLRT